MIIKDNLLKCLIYKQQNVLIFTIPVSRRERHTSSHQHHHHKDYYKVLNIKRNSTRKEIKLAYYKLSKKYHPDVSQLENSEDTYKDIQEAYHVLGDDNRKADYDESIRNGHYSGPRPTDDGIRYGGASGSFKKRPVYTGYTINYQKIKLNFQLFI